MEVEKSGCSNNRSSLPGGLNEDWDIAGKLELKSSKFTPAISSSASFSGESSRI